LLGAIHTAEHLGLWNVHRQCIVKLSLVLTKIDRNVQPNFVDPMRNRKDGQDSLFIVATSDLEPIWDKVKSIKQRNASNSRLIHVHQILNSGDDGMIFAGAYVLGCGKLKENVDSALQLGKIALGHALAMGNADRISSSAKLVAIASHNKGNLADRDVFATFWLKVSKAQSIDDWLRPNILSPVIGQLGSEIGQKVADTLRRKHDYQMVKRTVSLLPEIVARVGVNLASSPP
jgi:hypothetical protein